MLLPMALAVVGIICSIIGSFLVKTKENATQQSLLNSLRTGTYIAAILAAVLAAPLCYFILGSGTGWGVYRRHPLRPDRRLRHRLLHRVLHL